MAEAILKMNNRAVQRKTAVFRQISVVAISNQVCYYYCHKNKEGNHESPCIGRRTGPKPPFYVSRRRIKLPGTERPNAAVEHLFHECAGIIPAYREGNIGGIDSMTTAGLLQFPGLADTPVYHVGHPEPVTIPKTVAAQSV